MNEDMQAVTVSIAAALASRMSAAVQGVTSDSSTPSKSDDGQNVGQQFQDSEKDDAESSVVEISEDDDTFENFETRKGSRARNRVNRYEDNELQKKSRTNKRPGKDAHKHAWDTAIAEWESLTLETYKKRKGEKIKTLQNKIEKLRKEKTAPPKKQGVEQLNNKEKEKNDDLERAKKEQEKLLDEIKTLKQKEEDYKYRAHLLSRVEFQNRQTPPNDKVNLTMKTVDNEKSVDKTATDAVDILKAASKLRSQIYKSDKLKLKEDKNLSRKENEYAISQMGHQTEMAIMHADHNASIQRFKSSEFTYRERLSEQNYSRDSRSHMHSQWSNSSRPDYRRHENRSREIYTPRPSYDKRSRDFDFVEESSAKRSRGPSPEERYYDNHFRISSRDDTRILDQRSRDTFHFEERHNRPWRDMGEEERSYEERSRAFSSRHEQGLRSFDSRSHCESSQQRHREEYIDSSYSRGDSRYFDKNTPYHSSSSNQASRSVDSRSHYESAPRSREHYDFYQQRRDERIESKSEFSYAYESGEECEFEGTEYN